MRTTTTVQPITTDGAERADAVVALAGAFYDDPVFRWVYPDDDTRRAVLPGAFALFTDAIAGHGVSLRSEDGNGAALWVPPGEAFTDDEEAFGAAVAALSPSSPEDIERLFACMTLLGETHPHEECWYLNLIGVHPSGQGRGTGSALLEAALARCDADGVPAYLEATSAENRRLYERHGFVTTAELALPGGPSLWAMWYRPA